MTIVLMLMHVGMKCGSTKCRKYDGTCDGGQILVEKQELVSVLPIPAVSYNYVLHVHSIQEWVFVIPIFAFHPYI